MPKSEPYSKMSGGRGKGGRNKNKGRGGGSRSNRSSGSTTNWDSTSQTELSHYTYQVGSAKQASDFIYCDPSLPFLSGNRGRLVRARSSSRFQRPILRPSFSACFEESKGLERGNPFDRSVSTSFQ